MGPIPGDACGRPRPSRASAPPGEPGAGSPGPPRVAPGRPEAHRAPGPAVVRNRLLLVALVLAALNLRPAVTSLGPLLTEVRAGVGMSGAEQAEYRRRQRSRSLVMAVALGALAILFFAISLAKIM